MTQKPKRTGTARMRWEGKWWVEKTVVTKLTENELEIIVTSTDYKGNIRATSGDGIHYQGKYFYEKNAYQPGEVEFIRKREKDGIDILQGCWIERGAWTIELKP